MMKGGISFFKRVSLFVLYRFDDYDGFTPFEIVCEGQLKIGSPEETGRRVP